MHVFAHAFVDHFGATMGALHWLTVEVGLCEVPRFCEAGKILLCHESRSHESLWRAAHVMFLFQQDPDPISPAHKHPSHSDHLETILGWLGPPWSHLKSKSVNQTRCTATLVLEVALWGYWGHHLGHFASSASSSKWGVSPFENVSQGNKRNNISSRAWQLELIAYRCVKLIVCPMITWRPAIQHISGWWDYRSEMKTIMSDRPQTDQSPYMILRLLYLIMDLSWNHES